MSEQLFPRPRRTPKDKSGRRWRVKYDLTYEGGGGEWSGYYRSKTMSFVCAWFNVYVASYGGTAIRIDQWSKP